MNLTEEKGSRLFCASIEIMTSSLSLEKISKRQELNKKEKEVLQYVKGLIDCVNWNDENWKKRKRELPSKLICLATEVRPYFFNTYTPEQETNQTQYLNELTKTINNPYSQSNEKLKQSSEFLQNISYKILDEFQTAKYI